MRARGRRCGRAASSHRRPAVGAQRGRRGKSEAAAAAATSPTMLTARAYACSAATPPPPPASAWWEAAIPATRSARSACSPPTPSTEPARSAARAAPRARRRIVPTARARSLVVERRDERHVVGTEARLHRVRRFAVRQPPRSRRAGFMCRGRARRARSTRARGRAPRRCKAGERRRRALQRLLAADGALWEAEHLGRGQNGFNRHPQSAARRAKSAACRRATQRTGAARARRLCGVGARRRRGGGGRGQILRSGGRRRVHDFARAAV